MRYTTEEKLERIKKLIWQSQKTVAVIGAQSYEECGMPNHLADEEAYRIEDLYHYSPEEILSTVFYSTRREQFYEYYKHEIIWQDYTPTQTFYALKRLEDAGRLKTCLTQNVQGLERKVGLRCVVELHGSVHVNWCTKCGKNFAHTYLREAAQIPMCDVCMGNIRPGVRLFGEWIKNDVMTDAINALQDAEVVLILGSTIYELSNQLSKRPFFQKAKVILVSHEAHYTDQYADYALHGSIKEIVPLMF